MIQTSKLIPQGQGLAPVLLKRASTVELDWDVRQKSRFDTTDSMGRQIGVFLPRGTAVRGGDVLVAEDGSLIKVNAAPQSVLKITHCAKHGSPYDLIRAAYHLGNRHVPIELKPDHLKIEPDHVLADMLRAMHLIVTAVNEAFEPENGAYASGGHAHMGHDHGHSHAHHGDRDHAGEQGHTHEPAESKPSANRKLASIPIATASPTPHVHGPGCGHDH
jgi:urease accessory protein